MKEIKIDLRNVKELSNDTGESLSMVILIILTYVISNKYEKES
jgi:hypothetical protein